MKYVHLFSFLACFYLQGSEPKVLVDLNDIRFEFGRRYHQVIHLCLVVKRSDCISATDELHSWLKEQPLDINEKKLLLQFVQEIPDAKK